MVITTTKLVWSNKGGLNIGGSSIRIASKMSELSGTQANIQRYEQTIPLISQRVAAMETAFAQGAGSQVQLLELQEQEIAQQQHLIGERAREQQLLSDMRELQRTIETQRNTAKRENFEQIESLNQKLASAQQDLNKAQDLDNKQILTSSVTGRANVEI